MDSSSPLRFLFEPNAAILKAGAFRRVGELYNLKKLHPNTHIYTSTHREDLFPGRIFQVAEVIPFKPRKIRPLLSIDRAIISTRNFPWSADRLRKHLKMKEGGDHYLFGARTIDDQLIIIVCTPVGPL